MNRLTHGCCSEKLILPDEKEEDWNALRQSWLDDYQPDNQTFASMLEQTARAQWFLWRKTRQYNECEQSLSAKYAASIDWSEEDHLKVERFTRYRTTAERAFHRERNAVEQIRKNRALEAHRRELLDLELAREARTNAKTSAKSAKQVDPEPSGPFANFDLDAYLTKRVTVLPQLTQYVDVIYEDGKTTTKASPSNEVLLEKSKTMDPPPVVVTRSMSFHGGIPAIYRWVRKEVPGISTGRDQELTFDEWLIVIEQERERFLATGHIGPKDLADLALCDMSWEDAKIILKKLAEDRSK